MRIIKLHAIDSTNSFLKGLVKQNKYAEEMALIANHQTSGRGQWENSWLSEEDKSLTISIFKKINNIKITHQFYLSMLVAITLKKVLDSYQVPDVLVKWPNDILSGNWKVGGILIENCISGQNWVGSVIGIGLNVNNEEFVGLPKASSMKLLTETEFSVQHIIDKIIADINNSFSKFDVSCFDRIKEEYEKQLFGKGKKCRFNDIKTQTDFSGIIQGITDTGKLQILNESNQLCEYDLKTVKMYY